MAKSSRIEITPDDPQFCDGVSVFVPVARQGQTRRFEDIYNISDDGAISLIPGELGGHSLFAIQIARRFNKPFKFEIPLAALFDTLTVSALTLRGNEEKALGFTCLSVVITPKAPSQKQSNTSN